MAEEIISIYNVNTDQFKQKLRELENGLTVVDGKVTKTAKSTTDGFDNASKSVQNTSTHTKDLDKNTTALGGKFKQLGGFMVAAFSIGAIVGFGKSVLDITAKFQKFEAVLTNTLGSKSAAQKALKDIQDFASKTPFSVEELTASFVKLANQGFKPTSVEMRKLGDLAASQGKSFDQLAEGILDAQTGEFERLKEFGIRAEKSGDKVKFTFKGVQTQTDFTAASIQKYVLGLGDLQGVSGGMAAISKTLGGQISNLGDNFDSLLVSLGNAGSGLFSGVLDGMNALIGGLKDALIPASELAITAFDNQRESVLNLQNNIAPLADRYDVLAGKSTLSKDEQVEMANIIKEITGAIPSAVSAQDEYGNAIAISTDRVKEFIVNEKARLKVVNEEAITQTLAALYDNRQALVAHQKIVDEINTTHQLKKTKTVGAGTYAVQQITVLATEKEIEAEQLKNIALIEKKRGLTAELKRLEGDYLTEKPKEAAKAEEKITILTDAELKKRADAKAKAEKEEKDRAFKAAVGEYNLIKENTEAIAKLEAGALKEISDNASKADQDASNDQKKRIEKERQSRADANDALILSTTKGTEARIKAEIQVLNNGNDEILAAGDDLSQSQQNQIALNNEKILELEGDLTQKRVQNFNDYAQAAIQIYDLYNEHQKQIAEQEIQRSIDVRDARFLALEDEQNTLEASTEAKIAALNAEQDAREGVLDKRTAVEKEFDAKRKVVIDAAAVTQKKIDADKEAAAKTQRATERRIKREQFQREKDAAITKTIINTAVAVASLIPLYPLMALAAIAGAAEIATIAGQPTPSFFEGTSYLERGNNPKGRDTIPVMAHEGERIIPTKENLKNWNWYEALQKGGFEKMVHQQFVAPALEAQIKEYEKFQKLDFAQNVANSFMLNQKGLNDLNIVEGLRMTRSQARENTEYLAKAFKSLQANPRH